MFCIFLSKFLGLDNTIKAREDESQRIEMEVGSCCVKKSVITNIFVFLFLFHVQIF